ncbi:MAG: putative C-S lyase [Candidatus Aminicenantes bacterium]|nr:putative C-S lyase [Candidatus Aminicenantes bacterium]
MGGGHDFDALLDRRGTNAWKYEFCRTVLQDPEVIPMWVADMDFAAPPAVVAAVSERAAHGAFGYHYVPPSFWEAVVEWLRTRWRWEIRREWLIRSPGTVTALNLCVRAFTEPGDGVIVQTPVYYPFFAAAESNGRSIVRNPLRYADGRWTMDFEDFERRAGGRNRLLILCSPHNPVGRVWARDELERLADIVLARDLVVVSDEIHGDLVLPGRAHVPFASLSEAAAARTVTLIAPSKTFNLAGLSASAAAASNPGLLERLKREHRAAGLSLPNIFGTTAMETAYRRGADWLDALLTYLAENQDWAAGFLAERVPEIRLLRSEGTYLALLDCRALNLDQKALNEFFIREAKVYFSDGSLFGDELQGFERLNFACPRSVLAEALSRVERAVAGLRARGF